MLRVINPQRWNMYAYVVNNPLAYTDPDGRDAIAVNFPAEVPVGGHTGIIVVHSDGSAMYARFGPEGGTQAFGPGEVVTQPLSADSVSVQSLADRCLVRPACQRRSRR